MRMMIGFLSEKKMKGISDWMASLTNLKKNYSSRILYPVKITFRNKVKIKTCSVTNLHIWEDGLVCWQR